MLGLGIKNKCKIFIFNKQKKYSFFILINIKYTVQIALKPFGKHPPQNIKERSCVQYSSKKTFLNEGLSTPKVNQAST